jgi:acylphosphatase
MSRLTCQLLIQGKVQGVWYRVHLQEKAIGLGVTGWCRNLPDGWVEAMVQGPTEALDTLIQWCHQGPPKARVDSVEVVEQPTDTVFSSFEIEP